MFSKNSSKGKTYSTTIEETVCLFLKMWDNQRDFAMIDGVPCYMDFTDNGLVFTGGTCRVEIERAVDLERSSYTSNEETRKYEIIFALYEMDHTKRHPYRVLTICDEGVIMHYVKTGKEMDTILIPFEGINEVDFFQYETLGVICPLTAGTLTKLVNEMREIL